MGLSLEEAIAAATLNGAYAVGLEQEVGSVEVGKRADLVVLRSARMIDLLRVGVPAIFPRWCFRELNELRGDRGAQGLLQRHVDRVVRLAMPSAELDIDRPEDLLALEVATQVKRQQLGDS